ncbi:hypothetical protein E9531_13230 [Lampropedia puyangensis]|uniref:DUF2917 domain-containing protein n=1 Tax=Lampropedia puyangensis TaxID=1330072 RepID=A0A4S8EYN9_9BURK|nr:hypothetical protein [Lampropedia puyangensis]THT99034.1 hypothetical protein E9531_13230 [Lampropedia puyangensis]
MLHKTLPSTPNIGALSHEVALHARRPWWLWVWHRLLAMGVSRPSEPVEMDVFPNQAHYVSLQRNALVITQQGRCRVILPMQWHGAHVLQPHVLLCEGDVWEVPASGEYQVQACMGPGSAQQDLIAAKLVLCPVR